MENNATAPAYTRFIGILLGVCLYPVLLFQLQAQMGKGHVWLAVLSAAVLLGLAGYGMRTEKVTRRQLGLTASKGLQALAIAFLCWIVFALCLKFLILPPGRRLLNDTGPASGILYYWVFVAGPEELFFRGFLLSAVLALFRARTAAWRTAGGLVVANGIFALWHIPQRLMTGTGGAAPLTSQLVLLFVLGLLFSYFFLRTRNLWLAACVHGGWDAPLIGRHNDFLPVVIAVVLVEALRLIQKRRTSSA